MAKRIFFKWNMWTSHTNFFKRNFVNNRYLQANYFWILGWACINFFRQKSSAFIIITSSMTSEWALMSNQISNLGNCFLCVNMQKSYTIYISNIHQRFWYLLVFSRTKKWINRKLVFSLFCFCNVWSFFLFPFLGGGDLVGKSYWSPNYWEF